MDYHIAISNIYIWVLVEKSYLWGFLRGSRPFDCIYTLNVLVLTWISDFGRDFKIFLRNTVLRSTITMLHVISLAQNLSMNQGKKPGFIVEQLDLGC